MRSALPAQVVVISEVFQLCRDAYETFAYAHIYDIFTHPESPSNGSLCSEVLVMSLVSPASTSKEALLIWEVSV